jgi:multidrug transporter EmrE-like cation transporter
MALFTEILPSLPMYLLIALSASGVILGDYAAKTWSIDRGALWLVLAFAGYFFSAFFYIPSLLKEGLVVTSLLWDLLSVVGFLFIGLVIFNEKLTTFQTVGAALGVVALIILSVGEILR